jgi:hypothetical protein
MRHPRVGCSAAHFSKSARSAAPTFSSPPTFPARLMRMQMVATRRVSEVPILCGKKSVILLDQDQPRMKV